VEAGHAGAGRRIFRCVVAVPWARRWAAWCACPPALVFDLLFRLQADGVCPRSGPGPVRRARRTEACGSESHVRKRAGSFGTPQGRGRSLPFAFQVPAQTRRKRLDPLQACARRGGPGGNKVAAFRRMQPAGVPGPVFVASRGQYFRHQVQQTRFTARKPCNKRRNVRAS